MPYTALQSHLHSKHCQSVFKAAPISGTRVFQVDCSPLDKLNRKHKIWNGDLVLEPAEFYRARCFRGIWPSLLSRSNKSKRLKPFLWNLWRAKYFRFRVWISKSRQQLIWPIFSSNGFFVTKIEWIDIIVRINPAATHQNVHLLLYPEWGGERWPGIQVNPVARLYRYILAGALHNVLAIYGERTAINFVYFMLYKGFSHLFWCQKKRLGRWASQLLACRCRGGVVWLWSVQEKNK